MRTVQATVRAGLVTLLGLALLGGPAKAAPAADPADLHRQIAEAASQTQARCQGLIHHDTYEFEDCVLELLRSQRQITAQRLGTEYFGFVGALNSARMGMQGADDAMATFLPRFRRSQKRLGLNDLDLCRSVPGDCTTRIARIKLIEANPRPATVRQRDVEHQHVH
jgi:hypothetical protein